MSPSEKQDNQVRDGERIAKVMARVGLCSRRDAEEWIAAGRVSVNGEILASPAFNVGPSDDVRVDGKPISERQRTRLFAFHKPRGLVTTSRDPEGRQTVFEALPADLPRVVTIGRLDINTEGLLLLTNDGGLARVLELPETGWLRRYRVRAHGAIEQARLDELKDGVTVEGVHYAGIEARLERAVGANVWLMIGLREGKNREIKRVLEHLGLQVNRLIRVSFGPFELGDLREGAVAEVQTRVLRDQLGVRLAKKAHADFDAPILETPAEPPAPVAADRRDARDSRGERPRPQRAGEMGGERPPRKRVFSERGEEPAPGFASREDARGGAGAPKRPSRHAPQPRKRKHVSILRAEARDQEAEERRRVARSATKDRKGREVKVERISTVRAPGAPPVAAVGERGIPKDLRSKSGGQRPRLQGSPGSGRPARPPRDRAEGGERQRFDRPAGDRPARPSRDHAEGGERRHFERPTGDRSARPSRDRAEGGERKRFDRAAGERHERPRRDAEGTSVAAVADRGGRGQRPRLQGGHDGEHRRFERPAGDRPARPPRDRAEGGDRPARPPRKGPEGGRRPPPKGGPRGKRP
jgi:23S rRNA pseudouridine2605 synthase